MSELEQVVQSLIDRRELATKGSAEYQQIVASLGELIDKHPEAAHIAEEYNSNLGLE